MNVEYVVPLMNFPESYTRKYQDEEGEVDFSCTLCNLYWSDMQKKLISNIPGFEKQFLLAIGSVGLLPGERKKAARRQGRPPR